MSLLKLFLLLRSLPISELLNYPDDPDDEGDVRRWLLAVCQAADAFADLTDTTIDDSIVNAIKEVVSNEDDFHVIYSLVLGVLNYGVDKELRVEVNKASTKVGIAPTMIIAIIQVIAMLLKFIRDRRN